MKRYNITTKEVEILFSTNKIELIERLANKFDNSNKFICRSASEKEYNTYIYNDNNELVEGYKFPSTDGNHGVLLFRVMSNSPEDKVKENILKIIYDFIDACDYQKKLLSKERRRINIANIKLLVKIDDITEVIYDSDTDFTKPRKIIIKSVNTDIQIVYK